MLIAMIAGVAHTLKSDSAGGAQWGRIVRERKAAITRDHFRRAFPMKTEAMHVRVVQALARSGF